MDGWYLPGHLGLDRVQYSLCAIRALMWSDKLWLEHAIERIYTCGATPSTKLLQVCPFAPVVGTNRGIGDTAFIRTYALIV